jgi:RNA polymerase sigma-70 factor, ECF subfamily
MKTVSVQRQLEDYVAAFREGMQGGISYLFDAWYPSLCDYIQSLINDNASAEEIASEAFMKTWKYRQQLESAGDIRAYLFTIARRDAYKWRQRKDKRRQTRKRKTAQGQQLLPEGYLPEVLATETRITIADVIGTLPPRCREILQLIYLEGKDTDEIARELFISPYTVRSQKSRGLQILKPKLLLALGYN